MKKRLLLTVCVFMICLLCGCAKKCAGCNNEIEKNEEIQINDNYYCKNCVEYCASCKNVFVKESNDLQAIEGKKYCKKCAEEYAEYCTSCNTAFLKGSDKLETIDGKKYCVNCVECCERCKTAFIKGSDELQSVGGVKYCKDCIEYCTGCKTAFPKNSTKLLTYKKKHYCQDCFDKLVYPISLENNDKFSFSIVGYDDNNGTIAIKIKNKTNHIISVYQENTSVLFDSNKKCIAETDGTHSFAYTDVPAREDVTVFSSFRKSVDEWDTILKMSENHSFEFSMAVFDSEATDNFWNKVFKIKLTSKMFGYDD